MFGSGSNEDHLVLEFCSGRFSSRDQTFFLSEKRKKTQWQSRKSLELFLRYRWAYSRSSDTGQPCLFYFGRFKIPACWWPDASADAIRDRWLCWKFFIFLSFPFAVGMRCLLHGEDNHGLGSASCVFTKSKTVQVNDEYLSSYSIRAR